jgi:hypothetical protein
VRDRLSLWAAKLNELEIGRFVPDGNTIIYSGISREGDEIEIIRSEGDDVHYFVLCLDNSCGRADPTPSFLLFSLAESDRAADLVTFPYLHSSPTMDGEKGSLETWLLTLAVGTAIGWELLGRKHILSFSLTHGVFISNPFAHTSPYKWEINIPFFSMNTIPANYSVILVFSFFSKDQHLRWDYQLKFRPRNLVLLGHEGISRLIALATL